MNASPAIKPISAEEYLAMEETAEEKHEYYQGEIFVMPGATINHNTIVTNILVEIGQFLKGKPCRVFPSDLKVHMDKNSLFTYPDISIVCGGLLTWNNRNDVITNPVVLIEVLSKSTENYDRGEKFKLYRDLPSLKAYILISSREYLVEKLTRQNEHTWTFTELKGMENHLRIESIGLDIDLKEIYRDVDMQTEG